MILIIFYRQKDVCIEKPQYMSVLNLEKVPHIVVSSAKSSSNKENQKSKNNEQFNEKEYYLVASQIDPMFYGEPSTSFNTNTVNMSTG